MNKTIPFSLVFLAGGQGLRMGNAIPKQYLPVCNKPLALHSFEVFASLPEIQQIVVVCDPAYREVFAPRQSDKVYFAPPGKRRQDSLFNGIQLLKNEGLVCVHDAARPLIEAALIRKVMQEAEEWGAAVIGVPVKATIKRCCADRFIAETVERAQLWEMQTPQVAHLKLLKEGFEIAQKRQLTVTDDVSLVELTGKPVKVVEGSCANIKVTTPEDLILVERLCSATS